MPKFRIAREEDVGSVIKTLEREVFVKIDLCTNEEIDRTTWWVARDQYGNPVGYAGARCFKAYDPNKGNCNYPMVFLAKAGVIYKARGNGLQRRMIRCRTQWGKKQGAKAAITFTVVDNPPSSNNLYRCGFSLYAPESAWIDEEVLYWWKDLD